MTDSAHSVDTSTPGPLRRAASGLLDRFVPTDERQRARGSWLERKFQSAMLSIMVAAIIWGVGRLASIDVLSHDVQELKVVVASFYSADLARRDREETDRHLASADARTDAISSRLAGVERRVDRVEYVLRVAPSTAKYLRRAETSAAGGPGAP